MSATTDHQLLGADETTLEHVSERAERFFIANRDALLRLRIALVTLRRVQQVGAGDWRQAERTVAAMRELGIDVRHHVVESQDEVPVSDVDVVHVVPYNDGSAVPHVDRASVRRPLVAASTVYWDSYTHRLLSVPKWGTKLSGVARFTAKRVAALGGRVLNRDLSSSQRFRSCDLLLPNSLAEMRVIRSLFPARKDAAIAPVPNGIDIPPPSAYETVVPAGVPAGGYVLYPGVFAPRKNQLGFIRAMRRVPIPVVFMGGPVEISTAYYEACRSEAPSHHVFLGPIEHRSDVFYALMRSARVCCLASSCETPGLAALESATMGARVAITAEGGAREYLGDGAVYFSPLLAEQIRRAVKDAWVAGRDETQAERLLRLFSWDRVAKSTVFRYARALQARAVGSRSFTFQPP